MSAIEQRIADWSHIPADQGEPIQVRHCTAGGVQRQQHCRDMAHAGERGPTVLLHEPARQRVRDQLHVALSALRALITALAEDWMPGLLLVLASSHL